MRPKLVELLDLVEELKSLEDGQDGKQTYTTVSKLCQAIKVRAGHEVFESRFGQDYDAFNFYFQNDFLSDSSKSHLAKIMKRVAACDSARLYPRHYFGQCERRELRRKIRQLRRRARPGLRNETRQVLCLQGCHPHRASRLQVAPDYQGVSSTSSPSSSSSTTST